jgi:molecular chaperone DnaK
MEELQSRFQAISAELYKQAAASQPGSKPAEAGESSAAQGGAPKQSENVVDADFEVVDEDKKKD